jgi:hypothetical protein
MRSFWLKFLKRSVPVAVVLAIIGYVFAEAFLMLHRMNGGAVDPANAAVRWRTPLTMAGFGVALLFVMELVAFALSRKQPPVVGKPAALDIPTADSALRQSGQAGS